MSGMRRKRKQNQKFGICRDEPSPKPLMSPFLCGINTLPSILVAWLSPFYGLTKFGAGNRLMICALTQGERPHAISANHY
jgi:hypothetical protein